MLEFWTQYELEILRWLHILAMVYWLGGEWGVFQTSYKVVNPRLSFDERMRHMDTAYRIDILARTGIITLLPLGLHMGYLWNVQPLGGGWLVAMWAVWAVWMGVTYGAFMTRGKPIWKTLNFIEDCTRYVLIPTLIITAITSFMGLGPFEAGTGQGWYAAKVLTYGLALIIGVILRWVMHEWQDTFRILAAGPNAGVEAKLNRSIAIGRGVAYVYWVLIAMTCFFAAVKPF
jgi:hypothetical protein